MMAWQLADATVTGALITSSGAVVIAIIGTVAAIYTARKSARQAEAEAEITAEAQEASERAAVIEVAQRVLIETIQHQKGENRGLREELRKLRLNHLRCVRESDRLRRELGSLRGDS